MSEELIEGIVLLMSWFVSGFIGYQLAKYKYNKDRGRVKK